MANHVQAVWICFAFFAFIFCLLTGGLAFYHTFLITTGQTTWEHSRKDAITYLQPYNRSLLPFYVSIRVNVLRVFCHGGKCIDWKLRQPAELKEI